MLCNAGCGAKFFRFFRGGHDGGSVANYPTPIPNSPHPDVRGPVIYPSPSPPVQAGSGASSVMPWPIDRRASATAVLTRQGSDTFSSRNVSPDGTALTIGNLTDHGYALYQLVPGGDIPQTVAITLDSLTGEVFVALADQANQRWEISGPYSGNLQLPAGTQHVSENGNLFVALITNRGQQAKIQQVTLSVTPGTNQPPVAAIVPTPASGDAPLDVTLNGAQSSDSDGSIVRYEWDLDGNGIYEVDTGPTASADWLFQQPGSYSIGLQVTDNDGASDTATAQVTAHGWVFGTVRAGSGAVSLASVAGYPAVALEDGYACAVNGAGFAPGDWAFVPLPQSATHSLAVINGCPGVAMGTYIVGGNPGAVLHLNYARATTATGSNSADWTVVQASPFGNVGADASLAIIAGNPAISYHCFNTDSVWYVRATTATGMTSGEWGAPVRVDTTGLDTGYQTSLSAIAGNPAVSYRGSGATGGMLRYTRAITPTGDAPGAWQTPLTLDGGVCGHPDLEQVGGAPAVGYWRSGAGVQYAWSFSADGTALPDWNLVTVDDAASGVACQPSLASFGGSPVLASAVGFAVPQLYLTHAASDGRSASDWPQNPALRDNAASCSLTVISGRLSIAYADSSTGQIVFGQLF